MSSFRLTFWGVRGSIPVPGPTTSRYGGNTSCLELEAGGTRVILDAGTGARLLGMKLKQAEELHLVFTHLHWDHIQGFPFFIPIYRSDFTIHIYSGHKADMSLEEVLRGQMQEPNFPVNLGGLPARMTFNEVHKGDAVSLPGVTMRTVRLNHPNEAMGLRFERNGSSFVQLTDHEHTPEFEEAVVSFCRDADVLSMDTMFTPDNYQYFVGWGHSHWMHAVEIARKANVKKLVLFHHDPNRDDASLDQILEEARRHFPNTIMAYEGLVLEW